jgi:hypothetical protein
MWTRGNDYYLFQAILSQNCFIEKPSLSTEILLHFNGIHMIKNTEKNSS